MRPNSYYNCKHKLQFIYLRFYVTDQGFKGFSETNSIKIHNRQFIEKLLVKAKAGLGTNKAQSFEQLTLHLWKEDGVTVKPPRHGHKSESQYEWKESREKSCLHLATIGKHGEKDSGQMWTKAKLYHKVHTVKHGGGIFFKAAGQSWLHDALS